jgi:hypothetical protein
VLLGGVVGLQERVVETFGVGGLLAPKAGSAGVCRARPAGLERESELSPPIDQGKQTATINNKSATRRRSVERMSLFKQQADAKVSDRVWRHRGALLLSMASQQKPR